jgi:hypothetical protein
LSKALADSLLQAELMPTWSQIGSELKASKSARRFDRVRRKYLAALSQYTRRDVILYATKFTQFDPNIPPSLLGISDDDIHGVMEVVHGLTGPNLDLILHSPGGTPEAAEALVLYLRSKFHDIRVIVPQLALSAATLVACAANRIVMGKHSYLGPTDPQLRLGGTLVPAQAITEQFERGVRECADPAKLAAWTQIMRLYGPHLLIICENATQLSQELVQKWLQTHMFGQDSNGASKAKEIAAWLADHKRFKTHARHIPRCELAARGLIIDHLEDDQELQDLVLSVFHATAHTFDDTLAFKVIENHLGRAFIRRRRARPRAAGGKLIRPVLPLDDTVDTNDDGEV